MVSAVFDICSWSLILFKGIVAGKAQQLLSGLGKKVRSFLFYGLLWADERSFLNFESNFARRIKNTSPISGQNLAEHFF
jgi:hypothetical protein